MLSTTNGSGVGMPSYVSEPTNLLTYAQVENEAMRLAASLRATLGSRELATIPFVAIPRGGFFVLGMLSYVLNLSWEQCSPRNTAGPLVVVDDCALSGARFSRFLQSVDSEDIVFAHLFSPPALRLEIEHQESRVVACVASQDLRDLSVQRYPTAEEHRAWRDRWSMRGLHRPYWKGLPEVILFPWCEPDRPYWNPVSAAIEDHWRLAPPNRCLKNWAKLGVPPRDRGARRWRSPEHVAFSIRDGTVCLCNRLTGEVFGLDGVAADMWASVVAYGEEDTTVAHLIDCYSVDELRLRQDLRVFVAELLDSRLLETTSTCRNHGE